MKKEKNVGESLKKQLEDIMLTTMANIKKIVRDTNTLCKTKKHGIVLDKYTEYETLFYSEEYGYKYIFEDGVMESDPDVNMIVCFTDLSIDVLTQILCDVEKHIAGLKKGELCKMVDVDEILD